MSIELTTVLASSCVPSDDYPVQPVIVDPHGIHRFQENRIVRDLLTHASRQGFDLNAIACKREYNIREHQQLAQLIGYSVCGYMDLSYVDPHAADIAEEQEEKLYVALGRRDEP